MDRLDYFRDCGAKIVAASAVVIMTVMGFIGEATKLYFS